MKKIKAINAAKDLLTDWFSYNSWEDFPKLYRTLSAKEKLAVCLVLRCSTIFTDGCPPICFIPTTTLSALWKKSAKMQKRKANLRVQVEDNDVALIVDLFTGKVVRNTEYEILDLEDDL